MAYQLIHTKKLNEFKQEEIKEKRQIAGEDGVVTEHEILVQQFVHTWTELQVYQEVLVDENRSNFKALLTINATCGEGGNTLLVIPATTYNNTDGIHLYFGGSAATDYNYASKSLNLTPGETISRTLCAFDYTSSNRKIYRNRPNHGMERINLQYCYHNLDGSADSFVWFNVDEGILDTANPLAPKFTGRIIYTLYDIIQNEQSSSYNVNETFDEPFEPITINRAVVPKTATNFTDEENPTFSYAAISSKNRVHYRYYSTSGIIGWRNVYVLEQDTIDSVQAALSFDGETADVPYREIPIDGTNYTFNLTEEEREILREKAQGSPNVPIHYLVKITRRIAKNYTIHDVNYIEQKEFTSDTSRVLTIVGCEPTLNPTVRDVNSDTVALTGNENIFVRYESMAEFATGATASKHATIVSQSVQCGSRTVRDMYYGVIDDVESGNFVFNATDSRGLQADQVAIGTTFIEYIKPTCNQNLAIEMSGETGAVVTLKINGSYFNGSFGAASNELKLEVRHTQNDGEMGEWVTLTDGLIPVFKKNTYELTTTISGFDYEQSYVFQCRATDKLNFVETAQYTVTMLPIFDWDKNDFNFNVPVNIEADNLNMHGETIIRHNKTANNTVLSASGGHIYIRPKGTDETDGETIIYPNGDITFGGAVNLDNSFSVNGNALNDFVIDSGTESMGSNGTWHWRKWASGIAECYGCRNFGNMAITTAWGNLYRSAILTQDLPENVFIRTPDVININIVNAGFGGWICKHEETAPSAITTGSFIFVRPASATATPTYIGFHVLGDWK